MKKNELRTEDTEDTPSESIYNKDGITLCGAIFLSISKQSPLTAHPLTLSSPLQGD